MDDALDTRKRAWLDAYEQEGTVALACKTADVPRSTVYLWRQQDEAFALAWADIKEAVLEAMELEARRRAMHGTVEPLVSAGKHVCDVKKFSDTLLIFMLKAGRPEVYRDNFKVEHSGKIEHSLTELEALTDDDLLKRLAAGS